MNAPDPNRPHVFEEVDILPVTYTVASGEPSVAGYTMPPTPMSKAPQCGVCHRARDDRLHLEAEKNDSEHWPL